MAKIYDDSLGPIGAVCSSLLTLAQFQALYGTGWVLMDGGSCAGSVYASVTGASTVPDARGVVLRGKNNGLASGQYNPDGDSALGSYQADAFQTHTHNMSPSYASNVSGGAWSGGSTGTYVNTTGSPNSGNYAAETRMKNITVNHFIRIN